MARNIGDTGERSAATRRRHSRWLYSLALLVTTGLIFIPVLQAVHDTGVFELDGDATTGIFTVPSINNGVDDWDKVCFEVTNNSTLCGTSQKTTGATGVAWIAEPNNNSTIFTGGGSKDPIDINKWAWKDGAGGLPDKDNLVHAYAARYSLPPSVDCPAGTATTCEVLFFGSDRFDNSGDAQQGFWFLQNPIGLGTNSVGGGFGFTGVHRAGDVLVISDFSNGGTVSTITVYKWDPTCTAANKPDISCGDSNLRKLVDLPNARCDLSGPADQACGLVNPTTITLPWPFTDKSGTPNKGALNGEFYEAGINLSTLGLASECFASVVAETRSSTSTTATLKDFVAGGFGECTSGLTTHPQEDANEDQTYADISGNVTIPADATLLVRDRAVLKVTGSQSWSGTLNFFLCGPSTVGFNPAQGCVKPQGTAIGNSVSASGGLNQVEKFSDPATVTSAGQYCWRGEFTSATNGVPDSSDASTGECFTVVPVQPGVATVRTPGAGPVPLGTTLGDTATVQPVANQPNGSAAGGTVTFRLFAPGDTTCTTAVYTETVNLVSVAGSGTGSASTTTGYTSVVAGTYRWKATYSGNLPNTLGAENGCGDSMETTIVSPNQPGITTDASVDPPTGLPLGNAIFDLATLSGTASPSNGTFGTITFKAWGPNNATCTGNPVYTTVLTITGNGPFDSRNGSAGAFQPSQAGTYYWIASYQPATGDANNLSVSGACGDPNEASLLITLTPHVATSQFFYPNDTATITVASGDGALAGTVQFRVWTNNTCNGTPLYDSGAINVTTGSGGNLSRTLETNNTTNRTGAGSVYWRVDYVSTNAAHDSVPGTCGMENATITVTDKP